MPDTDPRRSLPGVDRLLAAPWCAPLLEAHGRPWVTARIRGVLDDLRAGRRPIPGGVAGYEDLIRDALDEARKPSLVPLINATGVILHTNLGRAPLAEAARRAMDTAAAYANLEFDLESGKRGSRYDHCVELIRELTGAEDGLVVNNCAAAVALALASHAGGRGVAVSHGELVEIGGGFRIPEVVEGAGARLVAVGTTNRTRLSDYARALDEDDVAAILKVHRSNFHVTGFTEDASLDRLVALGRERRVPVIQDLGSGLMIEAGSLGLPDEPTPRASVAAGADLVVWSGDKLLGGPQAGLVAGSSEAVARARRHPLCRAFRTDKVTLAALAATLDLYRDPAAAVREIPALRMVTAAPAELEARARGIVAGLPEAWGAEVAPGESVVGGGTFPAHTIETREVRWRPPGSVDEALLALRRGDPPVVARAREGYVVMDIRTVLPGQDDDLVRAVTGALAQGA